MGNDWVFIKSSLDDINKTLGKIGEGIDKLSNKIGEPDPSDMIEINPDTEKESPIDIEDLAARIINKMNDLLTDEERLKSIFEATNSEEYVTKVNNEFYKLSLEEDGYIDIEKIGI